MEGGWRLQSDCCTHMDRIITSVPQTRQRCVINVVTLGHAANFIPVALCATVNQNTANHCALVDGHDPDTAPFCAIRTAHLHGLGAIDKQPSIRFFHEERGLACPHHKGSDVFRNVSSPRTVDAISAVFVVLADASAATLFTEICLPAVDALSCHHLFMSSASSHPGGSVKNDASVFILFAAVRPLSTFVSDPDV